MMKPTILLAAIVLAASLCGAQPYQAPPPVRVREGRVFIRAVDCPLAEVLNPLCRAANCEWAQEAPLTNRVTLLASNLEPDAALLRVLEPLDYVIVWRPGRPSLLRVRDSGSAPLSGSGVASNAPPPAESAVRGFVSAYARESDPDKREEIEARLRAFTDPEAEAELTELASHPVGSPLQAEALTALANLGSATATDFLLRRIEEASPDAEEAAALVANVALSPRTAAALRSAALGNKRYVSTPARLAALQGLSRLHDGGTRAVVTTLLQDPDEGIRTAAGDRLNRDAGGL